MADDRNARFISEDLIFDYDDKPVVPPWQLPGYFTEPSPLERIKERVRKRAIEEVTRNNRESEGN